MSAFLIWSTYMISLLYLLSDTLGLIAASLRIAKRIWQYLYTRLWCRILMTSLLYLTAFGLTFWWAGGKLNFFDEGTLPVKDWEDRRAFGLGVSGFILAWLAIIGAILSAARTKAMEDANRQQVDDHRQRLYIDALETLNRKRDYQKAGAIESLRKLGSQEDGEYRTQAIEILTAFIRSTARIADKNTERRLDPSGTALNLASALYALSDLLSEHGLKSMHLEKISSDFKNLDLSELVFANSNSNRLAHLNFYACNFSDSNFINQKISSVIFSDCDFTTASLYGTHFILDPSSSGTEFIFAKFEGTIISNTNFEGVSYLSMLDLIGALYEFVKPPRNIPNNVEDGFSIVQPLLPAPWEPLTGHYYSGDETRNFHYSTNDKYRPHYVDGSFVRIVDSISPELTILDQIPSSEPNAPTP